MNNKILDDIKKTKKDLIKFSTYQGNDQAFIDLFSYVKEKMSKLRLEDLKVVEENIDLY